MGSFGKDLTEIAVMLVGVAAMALLVGHAAGTSAVINSVTSGFGGLLSTVELPATASNGPSTNAYSVAGAGNFGALSNTGYAGFGM
jgi:hypothetical protein